MKIIFSNILLLSFIGSLAVIIFFSFKNTLEKKQSASLNYQLCKIIIILFIIPIHIFFRHLDLPITNTETPYNPSDTTTLTNNQIDIISQTNNNFTPNPLIIQEKAKSQVNSQINFDIFNVISILWCCISFSFTCMYLIQFIKFNQQIKQTQPITNTPLNKILKKQQKALNINKEIQLYTNNQFSTPFISGLFTSRIILDEKNISISQANYIFKHELIHYQRKDLVWKYAYLVIKIFHWFNPLVYLFEKQFLKFLEYSCDEKVISNFSKIDRKEYASTIIDTITAYKSKSTIFEIGLISSKENLKNRISKLLNYNSKHKSSIILHISIIALIGITLSSVSCYIMPIYAHKDNSLEEFTTIILEESENIYFITPDFTWDQQELNEKYSSKQLSLAFLPETTELYNHINETRCGSTQKLNNDILTMLDKKNKLIHDYIEIIHSFNRTSDNTKIDSSQFLVFGFDYIHDDSKISLNVYDNGIATFINNDKTEIYEVSESLIQRSKDIYINFLEYNYSEPCFVVGNGDFNFNLNYDQYYDIQNKQQLSNETLNEAENEALVIFNQLNATLPVTNYSVTCGYLCYSEHRAVDITSDVLNVVSFANGSASEVGYSENLGNYIVINHENDIQTKYAHLDKILVKTDEVVTSGQAIAIMGSTGMSTGTHLHFELIKNGISINPDALFN